MLKRREQLYRIMRFYMTLLCTWEKALTLFCMAREAQSKKNTVSLVGCEHITCLIPVIADFKQLFSS